jgi:hypothetical protein
LELSNLEDSIIKLNYKWIEWLALIIKSEYVASSSTVLKILSFTGGQLNLAPDEWISTNFYDNWVDIFINYETNNAYFQIYSYIWWDNESRTSCHYVSKEEYVFKNDKFILVDKFISTSKFDLLNWMTWYNNLWSLDGNSYYCYSFDNMYDFKNKVKWDKVNIKNNWK